MAANVFVDENKQFWFDFSKALWASNELNDKYKKIQSVLNDVDFIVETDQNILFIEYKNSDVTGAANPQAFAIKITSDKHYMQIAKKYYGSILYALACNLQKSYRYIYILECALAGSTDRLRLRNKIGAKLPFQLQKGPEFKLRLINDFEILSISEWNANPIYAQFPISPVKLMASPKQV